MCDSRARLVGSLLLSLSLLHSGTMSAQSWTGNAAIGVQVLNAKGKPVADAKVELAYRGWEGGGAGPVARLTDSSGMAGFVGLAEGTWSLRVSHPEHLSYMASLTLRRSKKPTINSDFLHAEGAGRLTWKIKFQRDVQQGWGNPVETDAQALVSAPAPDPVVAPPAALPEAGSDPPVAAAASAETAEPGQSADVAGTQPQAMEPAGDEHQPAKNQTTPPTAPPAIPDPTPTTAKDGADSSNRQAPSPSAEPEVEAEDSVAPAAAVLHHPPDRSSLRSYADRTCFECKPGEWAVSSTVVVSAGNGCPPEASTQIRTAIETAAASGAQSLDEYTGSWPPEGAEIAPGLEAYGRSASCRPIAVVIPPDARFTGVRMAAEDRRGGGDCLAERECPVAAAKWLSNPEIVKTAHGSILYSIFANSSPAEVRTANLTVFFIPRD